MAFKKILFYTLLIALIPLGLSADIVNNSGSTAADSISFEFYLLDSAGVSMPRLLGGDSVFMHVYYPSGAIAFRDSVVGTGSAITEQGNSSFYTYNWNRAVADIDGSGKDGVYKWILNAKDISLGLPNPFTGSFQVYQRDDFNIFAERQTDSLQGIIDSLQSQDDWIAQQTSLLAAIDSINAVIDSLQNLSVWAAHQSTLDSILDTIPPNFNALSIVAGSGEVGLDLDNTRGTLDAGEIGTDAIGAVQLASSAALEIADSVLNDSSSFQGSDSAQTARAVWNTPQTNHTTAGTFGKYLDSEISGLSSGGGAFSQSLLAYDSTISQVIPQVAIAVRNIDQTALLAVGRTGSDGLSAFNLDADNFSIVASATGYIFDPFDTLVVTGSGLDTIYGAAFNPGSPASPSLCRVFGYIYNVSGAAEKEATIIASLPAGVSRLSSLLISPFQVSATTDSIGYFFLDLIPTDLLSPTGTRYEITIITDDGALLRQRLTVPDATSWQMTW